jgi:hypothetical protein
MKDELYWQLDTAQLIDWLLIQGDPLEDKPVGKVRVPYLSTDDIKAINQVIDTFRSKRAGTNEGGPVVYPIIDPETADRSRSGYCWFLEKPLTHFRGHYTEVELMIHKYENDWYLVKYEDNPVSWNRKTHWFVCDEIEGLIRLLKNLF